METLFELPEPTQPRNRVGSNAWKLDEFMKMRELSKIEGGLTPVFFAKIALGLSKQRVYQLIEEGRLPCYEIMGKKMVSCNAIEAFLRLERPSGRRIGGLAAA